jgi:lipopolysaccharide export system permease protein
MKIINRYILREVIPPFLMGLFTFSLIVLLHRFSRLADLVIAKGVPSTLVLRLILSLFPAFLEIALPASLLLGILLTLGRLGSDSETTAMQAAGMGMRGIARPFVLLAGVTFVASLALSWEGIPWGYREMRAILAQVISVRAGAAAEEHVFREVAPGVLLFPERVSQDGTKMTGIFLSQRLPGREALLVFAREGEFVPVDGHDILTLRLSDGAIHHEDPVEGTYRMAAFRTMEFRLPRSLAAGGPEDDPKGLTLPQLYRRSSIAAGTGPASDSLYHFHRRLSLSFSCLAFALLAVPLGLSQKARGKSPAFALTVALILLYYVFLAAAGGLQAPAPLAMVLLMWLPNALVLALAAWILRQSEHRMLSLPLIFRGLGRKR